MIFLQVIFCSKLMIVYVCVVIFLRTTAQLKSIHILIPFLLITNIYFTLPDVMKKNLFRLKNCVFTFYLHRDIPMFILISCFLLKINLIRAFFRFIRILVQVSVKMTEITSVSKKLLDQLAYDYLHSNGFTQVAKCLKKESQILTPRPEITSPPTSKKSSLNSPLPYPLKPVKVRKLKSIFTKLDREKIKNSVLSGNLNLTEKLISKADLNFFDKNENILFETRLQELIENVKLNNLSHCLKLANHDLKILVKDDPNRLEQVQRALSLMIQTNKFNQDLLDNSRRLYLWSEINRASLSEKVCNTEPGNTQSSLDSIFQVGKWAEKKLLECSETNPDFSRNYLDKNENFDKNCEIFDYVKMITEGNSLRYKDKSSSKNGKDLEEQIKEMANESKSKSKNQLENQECENTVLV